MKEVPKVYELCSVEDSPSEGKQVTGLSGGHSLTILNLKTEHDPRETEENGTTVQPSCLRRGFEALRKSPIKTVLDSVQPKRPSFTTLT